MCLIQRFALNENPERFLKAPLRGAFKNLSGLLKASINCFHTDVSRLLELGLIERAKDGMVFVPFEAIKIR